MKVGGWLMLDTVTTSQTLTLDTQDKQDGHPAYILKSPLNEQELFVVEFRKKDTGLDSYDRFIGGSGVIVYRINPAVEGLSNLMDRPVCMCSVRNRGRQDIPRWQRASIKHIFPKKKDGQPSANPTFPQASLMEH